MKKISRGFIFIFVITLLTGCFQGRTTGGDVPLSEVKDYMQANYSPIVLEDEDEFLDLTIMDADLDDKEIFFTAELHGVLTNSRLQMKFLKYFKAKTNFDYYLIENSYSAAYFLNKYLDSGDISILEELYVPLRGTYAWTQDSFQHWQDLYEYNQGLDLEDRIRVVGIDIEHQFLTSYRYLVDVLPAKEAPDPIKETIAELQDVYNNFSQVGDDGAWRFSTRLAKDITKQDAVYRNYLGEDFLGFQLVNQNVLNAAKAYGGRTSDRKWNNTRDKMIYQNFLAVQEELALGKYYGQWGLNHAFQSQEGKMKWFAAYLNAAGSAYQNKILSIAYFYDSCQQMTRQNNNTYGSGGLTAIYPEIRAANDAIGGQLNLYRLTGPSSPFASLAMYESSTGRRMRLAMDQFFQYILCIKDAPASSPLGD